MSEGEIPCTLSLSLPGEKGAGKRSAPTPVSRVSLIPLHSFAVEGLGYTKRKFPCTCFKLPVATLNPKP